MIIKIHKFFYELNKLQHSVRGRSMEPSILKNVSRFNRGLCVLLIISLLVSSMLPSVAAKSKEFDVKEFQESYNIPPGEIRAMDFSFQEGDSS